MPFLTLPVLDHLIRVRSVESDIPTFYIFFFVNSILAHFRVSCYYYYYFFFFWVKLNFGCGNYRFLDQYYVSPIYSFFLFLILAIV